MRFELTTSDRERFERYVDRSGGPDACHPWTRACDTGGYGRFWVDGRLDGAHRVAWCLAGNEITPEKPFVLHHCDNRRCCNERHLWAGTNAANLRDMARKGRGTKSGRGLPCGVKVEITGRFGAYARDAANGRQVWLGTYDTAEKASAIASAKKMELLREAPNG